MNKKSMNTHPLTNRTKSRGVERSLRSWPKILEKGQEKRLSQPLMMSLLKLKIMPSMRMRKSDTL